MSDQNLVFFFQHQYVKKWMTYKEDELSCLSKAVQRNLKSVTLKSKDKRKKLTVNFDKMVQKNAVSGIEQNVRCIIFNTDHIAWMWRDDFGNWLSFTPRVTMMLEIAYVKNVKYIELFIKESYKFNLEEFLQINIHTNYVRAIKREAVMDISYRITVNYFQFLGTFYRVQNFISAMSREDIIRSKAVVFNLEYSPPKGHLLSPILASSDEIISTLSAQAQASSSVEKKTVTVDPDCPNANQYHVYFEDDNIFNATLNFANVIDNNNKYFIIQLLKNNITNQYAVWSHYGRLGYKGENYLVNCGKNLDKAKSEFKKKFFSKTGNQWSDRKNFERIQTKYDLVHSDLDVEYLEQLSATVGSKLDIKVQELLGMISNKRDLEEAATELYFDSLKTSLGKIQAKQIIQGYDALNKISELIIEQNGMINGKLIEACNNFYTKIPHDFKRKTPPILSTMHQVKEKLHMLEDLTQISLAYDVLDSSVDRSVNIIDMYYERLNCNITPLDHSSDKFQALNKYLIETHGSTHKAFDMELIDAFACEKTQEAELFKDVGNIKLLWHGSRLSNWLGVLKTGLQIAPPEAPSTGYMFGKGIYFADCSSKSANYCFATKKCNENLLLLSEVALGRPKTVYEARDYAAWMKKDFQSIFAPGRTKPKDFESTVLSSEAVVPVGPLVENNKDHLTLQYNEYVVYDTNQVKMKYLLRIKFNFK